LLGNAHWREDIMEKRIAGLLGAVAALGTLNAAQAAPAPAAITTDVLQVNSYAELLEPIPNAAATLRVVDEQAPANTEGNVQLAQFYHHHHHHHHHHHRYWRRGPVVVVPHRWHHHHHHHHHHHGYDRY
jgi:G3E family GTPase